MFLLRFEIVQILLGHGHFSANDVTRTAQTLAVLLTGTLFDSLIFILARGFYARKNTRTPVVIGIVAVVTNIAVSIIGSRVLGWGIYGLALGNAVAAFLNCTALYFFLARGLKHSLLEYRKMLQIIVACCVLAGVVYAIRLLLPNGLSPFMTTALLSSIGGSCYLGTLVLLKKSTQK